MGLSYERQHINMLIQPTLGPTEICVFVESNPTPHIPSQQIYHPLHHMHMGERGSSQTKITHSCLDT